MIKRQIVAAASLIAVFLLFTYPSFATGSLSVKLTAQSEGNMEHLYVTFTSVMVHKAGVGENVGWVTLFNRTATIDILTVRNVTDLLAQGRISVGNYDRLRLTISNATGVLNGTSRNIELPSTQFTVPITFTMSAGSETIVVITMTARVQEEGGNLTMSPLFTAALS